MVKKRDKKHQVSPNMQYMQSRTFHLCSNFWLQDSSLTYTNLRLCKLLNAVVTMMAVIEPIKPTKISCRNDLGFIHSDGSSAGAAEETKNNALQPIPPVKVQPYSNELRVFGRTSAGGRFCTCPIFAPTTFCHHSLARQVDCREMEVPAVHDAQTVGTAARGRLSRVPRYWLPG